MSRSEGALDVVTMKGLSKSFYAEDVETRALENIDLTVARGDFLMVGGPSGCGKSTLLSIIGLLDEASAGIYLLAGTNVCALAGAARARIRNREIGYVFQNFNLIGDMTVYENVELPLVYGGAGASERSRLVRASLERVGMTARLQHYPAQLSGGQQQRVAVARAIVNRPSIVLADEPTGNLDSRNGEAVMSLLEELHKAGATICMVTHDPRYVKPNWRYVEMSDGRVVRDSSKDR